MGAIKRIGYGDYHAFGCIPKYITKYFDPIEYGPYVYFAGDMYDINCRKKDVNEMIRRHDSHTKMIKLRGGHEVRGNHEGRLGLHKPSFIIHKGLLIVHLNQLFWSDEKNEKWENKPIGLGRFARAHRIIRNSLFPYSSKPSEDKLKQIAMYAKSFGVKAVYCGHPHLKEMLEVTRFDVQIIIGAMGKKNVFYV